MQRPRAHSEGRLVVQQPAHDWDEDWNCERTATTSRASLDVWGLIHHRSSWPSAEKGVHHRSSWPSAEKGVHHRSSWPGAEKGKSSSSSAIVAPVLTERAVLDGDIWDFVGSSCSDKSEKVMKSGSGHVDGDIWSFMSRDMKTSRPPEGYEVLLLEGGRLSKAERARFHKMAWWSDASTASGARAFILAPRELESDADLPFFSGARHVNMRRLLAYALSVMHEHVVKEDKQFVVIWVQMHQLRILPCHALMLKRSVHDMYFKNLIAMHVVHPSWSLRCLELAACCELLDGCFAEKLYCHERLEFLDQYVDLKGLAMPSDLYDYEKFLERRAEMLQWQMEHGFDHGCARPFW